MIDGSIYQITKNKFAANCVMAVTCTSRHTLYLTAYQKLAKMEHEKLKKDMTLSNGRQRTDTYQCVPFFKCHYDVVTTYVCFASKM